MKVDKSLMPLKSWKQASKSAKTALHLRTVLLSFVTVSGVTFQMVPEDWKSIKAMSWTISEASAGGSREGGILL